MREAPRCGAISLLKRAHRLSSSVQAWSSIVTFDPVIARQAQELTLMDALVFVVVGRTRNGGLRLRSVRCGYGHRPTDAANAKPFTARSRTAASVRRGSSYGRGYQPVERRP